LKNSINYLIDLLSNRISNDNLEAHKEKINELTLNNEQLKEDYRNMERILLEDLKKR